MKLISYKKNKENHPVYMISNCVRSFELGYVSWFGQPSPCPMLYALITWGSFLLKFGEIETGQVNIEAEVWGDGLHKIVKK